MMTTQVYDEITSGIPSYPELERIVRLIENDVFQVASLTGNKRKHFIEKIFVEYKNKLAVGSIQF